MAQGGTAYPGNGFFIHRPAVQLVDNPYRLRAFESGEQANSPNWRPGCRKNGKAFLSLQRCVVFPARGIGSAAHCAAPMKGFPITGGFFLLPMRSQWTRDYDFIIFLLSLN